MILMQCGVENHSNYTKEAMKECQKCGLDNCPDCLSYENKCYHCENEME